MAQLSMGRGLGYVVCTTFTMEQKESEKEQKESLQILDQITSILFPHIGFLFLLSEAKPDVVSYF